MTDTSPFLGNTGIVPGSPEPSGFFGPYRGIVTNTMDPAAQNRIKAVVPQLFGNTSTECDWALPCQLPGLQAIPPPGQGVWIMFEGGDLNYPVYMGMWQADPAIAPYDTAGAATIAQANAEAYTTAEFAAFYPALTIVTGSLAAPYDTTTGLTTFLTTPSLAVGVWLINAAFTAIVGNATVEITPVVGTATATFAGQTSGEALFTTAFYTTTIALNFIATVTVAGTLTFQAISNGSGPVIEAVTPTHSYSPASGYTATRIQ